MTSILCVTRNALAAVRLMVESLNRYTEEPFRLLVADQGSTDGTLRYLRSVPGLRVYSLADRRRCDAAGRRFGDLARVRLLSRLERFATDLSPSERAVLAMLRDLPAPQGEAAEPDVTDHGQALDWLARRVRTPFFVTVDSDVEFLASGWLSAHLILMKQRELAALGEFEAGLPPSRPRLAPCLLVLRTSVYRDDRLSFQGRVEIHAPDEAALWQRRTRAIRIDRSELEHWRSAVFYDTAAGLFEALVAGNRPWATTPPSIRRTYRHFGHMSWSGDRRESQGADPALRAHFSTASSRIRQRLARLYHVR